MNSMMAGFADYQSLSFTGNHSPLPLLLALEIFQLVDVVYLKGGIAIRTAQFTLFRFQTAFKRICVGKMGMMGNFVHFSIEYGAFIQV